MWEDDDKVEEEDVPAAPVPPAPSAPAAVVEPEATRTKVRFWRLIMAFGGAAFLLYLLLAPVTCGRASSVESKIERRSQRVEEPEMSDEQLGRIYARGARREAPPELGEAFNSREAPPEASRFDTAEPEAPEKTLREVLYAEGLTSGTRVAGLAVVSGGAQGSSGAGSAGGLGGGASSVGFDAAFERAERAAARLRAGGGSVPVSTLEARPRSAAGEDAETLALPAGTVISARLMTEINSDLPGTVLARVDRDVLAPGYEETVLPVGLVLIGEYSSDLAFEQDALFVGWHTLVYPNGEQWSVRDLPSHDHRGAAGLRDKVNHHTWQVFGRAALLGMVSAAFDIGRVETSSDVRLSSAERGSNAVVTEMERAAGKLLDRSVDRKPTVRIRAGQPFYVLLTTGTEFPVPDVFGPQSGRSRLLAAGR